MADIDTNLVVVDVVTMWSIDAALFLLAGLGFLAWSTVARGAGQSVAAFAIELAVCLVVERWATTLHRADRLKGASPLPAGARRGSVLGYTLKSVAVVGVSGAVAAGAATALSSPNLIGGWFAAYGVIRLVSAVRARRMERRDRVEYSVSMGSPRNRRAHEYYVRSPAF
jgi:hypothetical protein